MCVVSLINVVPTRNQLERYRVKRLYSELSRRIYTFGAYASQLVSVCGGRDKSWESIIIEFVSLHVILFFNCRRKSRFFSWVSTVTLSCFRIDVPLRGSSNIEIQRSASIVTVLFSIFWMWDGFFMTIMSVPLSFIKTSV